MFADPSRVTINAINKDLIRINQDSYGSEYFLREAAQEFRMKIRNTSYKDTSGRVIDRHNIEFTQTIYAVTGTTPSPQIVRKAYVVTENLRSDTDAGNLQTLVGFVGFLTSANLQKLLNYES